MSLNIFFPRTIIMQQFVILVYKHPQIVHILNRSNHDHWTNTGSPKGVQSSAQKYKEIKESSSQELQS